MTWMRSFHRTPPPRRQPKARRPRRLPRPLGAVVLAAALSLVATAGPATAEEGEWQLVPLTGTRPITTLTSVSAQAAGTVWAVGQDALGHSAPGFPLILRWNGESWTKVATGVAWQGFLTSVAATSEREAWALGRDANQGSHVLRWNGTAWGEVRSPAHGNPDIVLRSVRSGGGPTWLAGQDNSAVPGPRLWRWGGSRWVSVPTPPDFTSLETLHVRGADDVWISLATGVAHWDGTAWQVLPVAPRCGVIAAFSDLLAVSASDVWAAGACRGPGTIAPLNPMLMHWDGTAWTRFDTPGVTTGALISIAPDDQGRPAWISAREMFTVPTAAAYFHFDGTAWTLVRGAEVEGETAQGMFLGHVPGTSTTFSVGAANVTGGQVPRIERNG
jgi:hypothetical protein